MASTKRKKKTHVFLLLVDMADLEPDVGVRKGIWRVAEDAIEALE